LSGTVTPVVGGTAVDLSAAGLEWAQWSEAGVNRKSGITPLIGDLMVLGPNSGQAVSNFPVLFSWTNGTPIQAASNVTTALAVKGVTNGFVLTVPADTVKRKLRLYAGCEAAQIRFQAMLSDGSAPPFLDSSVSANTGVSAA